MPMFKYCAVNGNGEYIDGTYTAGDKSLIIAMIHEKQFLPVRIEEVAERKEVDLFAFMSKVKTKDLAIFCRQFYTMLNSGVTIIKCLDILQQQTESKKLKAVTKEVYDTVQKGAALSEALKKHRDSFPDLMIYMVEAGEVSGSLDKIMERMSVHFEKEHKIMNKVKSTMVYPIVLSIVATLVVIFLLTFIMPMFFTMFSSSGVELPLPTRILLALSFGIRSYWFIIFPGIFLIFYFIRKYMKTDKGRLAWDKAKLRMPVVKGAVQKLATSRFARTLSTLLASGMPLLQAMEVVSKVVGNKVASDGILQAREDMRRGMDLAGPIKRIGVFPPMVDSMIRIGEESGTLDDILEKTAGFYDEEVEVALQRMVSLLEPIMIIIMAAIIGFIVISMALPMFSMMQTIK